MTCFAIFACRGRGEGGVEAGAKPQAWRQRIHYDPTMALQPSELGTPKWAVIDIETTGFSARDRVIEFACLLLTADGEVVDEFDTLIYPERPPGPTHIHGITEWMLMTAPKFEEVAPEIAERLDGKIVVAHNIPFDERMLRQEMERIEGAVFKLNGGVCTYALSKAKLEVAAAKAGWVAPRANAHTALGDSKATAHLLAAHFQEVNSRRFIKPAVCLVPEMAVAQPEETKALRRSDL